MNWNNLDKLSDLLQVINFALLLEDNTNNDIMKELQNQDNILNEQTEVYLKEMNNKLDKIINLLERR